MTKNIFSVTISSSRLH